MQLDLLTIKNILGLLDNVLQLEKTGKDILFENQELGFRQELLGLATEHVDDVDGLMEVALVNALKDAEENGLDHGVDQGGLAREDFEG